jgi:hypothetical protein
VDAPQLELPLADYRQQDFVDLLYHVLVAGIELLTAEDKGGAQAQQNVEAPHDASAVAFLRPALAPPQGLDNLLVGPDQIHAHEHHNILEDLQELV